MTTNTKNQIKVWYCVVIGFMNLYGAVYSIYWIDDIDWITHLNVVCGGLCVIIGIHEHCRHLHRTRKPVEEPTKTGGEG
jgi:hypothetical protein